MYASGEVALQRGFQITDLSRKQGKEYMDQQTLRAVTGSKQTQTNGNQDARQDEAEALERLRRLSSE